MLSFGFETDKINNIIKTGAASRMTDREFLEAEIRRWKGSRERLMQIKGYQYYAGDHDILMRKRTMIGEEGKLKVVENLPNNLIVNNQYEKMVSQKANYLVGQPFVVECRNATYAELLKKIFGKRFMKTLKNAAKASLNGGLTWMYPYYTDTGELAFRLFPAYEILPFWADSEHTILDSAVRVYIVEGYEGTTPVLIEKVEVYDLAGIHRYVLEGDMLIPDMDGEPDSPHVYAVDAAGNQTGFNWSKIPLIPLKRNESEIPLIKKVKSLQDGINIMLSDFENNMQEDARNTILVIKNYDGTDLGDFRKNLSTYGAIKVRYDGEAKGGVETLEVTVNADNYKAIVDIFKKALIENAMGFDAKDDRIGGTPNQMNIQSMYSDIDLDANDMETEYQAAFEEILWFIAAHIANTGQGDFTDEQVDIIFNRDMMMNEAEIITACRDSVGILSDETIVGQHPWVDDVRLEMKRLEEQKKKVHEDEMNSGYNPFRGGGVNGDETG